MRGFSIGAVVVLCGLMPFPAMGADVTFSSLLDEMVDLERLAEFPSPAYVMRQFSSYDRRSANPAIATDQNWFANGDAGQFVREESFRGATEYVLMDAAGPGAVVRIWSANPDGGGVLRIYLDESYNPVVEMPLADMLGGRRFPFVKPVCGVRGTGWNSYLPIPYARHCKITSSRPGFYYHVGYRTYETDADVETFSVGRARQNDRLLRSVAERLAHPEGPSAPEGPIQQRKFDERRLYRGDSRQIELSARDESANRYLVGGAAIRRIRIKAEGDDLEGALRGVLLEVFLDGQSDPAVQAPLGDFFGTAPGLNPYRSLPCGVVESGWMYSHWVMPFADSAIVRMTNLGPVTATLSGEVDCVKRTWTDSSMYFHAKWHSDFDIPVKPRRDWNYVTITGRGRYVGNMLHVANPVSSWWGEGDEKVYVDGEAFPSTFGTGTEDYYGYAWGSTDLFSHAYHNQTRCDGPATFGHTCLSRFHVMDDMPFSESFRFDMEIWHHAGQPKVSMGAMCYWYAMPGSGDNLAGLKESGMVVPGLPKPVPSRRAVLEGEDMRVVSRTGGKHFAQWNYVPGWSGWKALWWTAGKWGKALELSFDAEEAGRYDVRAAFAEGVDCGIFDLYVGKQKTNGPWDFYRPDYASMPERSLGVFDLKKGANALTVMATGANPKARPSHLFVLDYIRLVPVE